MQADSANSFNDIYTAFYRKSYLFVRSYVHDDMAAEDIASDALIKLWEQMKRTTIDPVGPFLFTILKNQALDYLKHQGIRKGVHEAITAALVREKEIRTATLEASDPKAVFSSEIQEIIERTLNTLPEKTREIFIMSRFGNKPNKEIAELYQISVKGVDYHILQSVKELRIALKDYFAFVGNFGFPSLKKIQNLLGICSPESFCYRKG
jgi:RNA polymerase sigma-70 factor (ECF subfamily)